MSTIVPVILCGGSGTRLWPMSRENYPKQFVALSSGDTLFQKTIARCQMSMMVAPMIVCNEEHRFIVAEQLLELNCERVRIVLEPEAKNTAPAIALAALLQSDDAILVVMPSDHIIDDNSVFKKAIDDAAILAENGYIVTLGIEPNHPATGYGYIKKGDALEIGYRIKQFVEKPSYESAQTFSNSGDFFWNGGIFIVKSSVYLQALEEFAPAVLVSCREAVSKAKQDVDFLRVDRTSFSRSPSISIDYAVMEHTPFAAVVPLHTSWSDVGSWNAWWAMRSKTETGNALEGDVVTVDVKNCLIRAESRLVAATGIADLIVIETADAVLIASQNDDQKIKSLVKKLDEQARSEVIHHRKVHRLWGAYDCVDAGHRYQVKRITVKPGAKLSLQKHEHRAEHWVVVKGTATVTRGDDVFTVNENESTFIPVGVVHRLENATDELLEIIEVQSGDYLGEDDITRLEDGVPAKIKSPNKPIS